MYYFLLGIQLYFLAPYLQKRLNKASYLLLLFKTKRNCYLFSGISIFKNNIDKTYVSLLQKLLLTSYFCLTVFYKVSFTI